MQTHLYTPAVKHPQALNVGWLYPAPQSVALGSLGYLGLYAQLDQDPNINPVMLNSDNIATGVGKTLSAIGISFSFELDILEILKQLEQLSVPIWQNERHNDHPLIFSGGPVPTTNAEPYAEFFDFFIIGDGEGILQAVLTTIAACQQKQCTRAEILLALAQQHAGVYVPSLYHVSYQDPTGPIAAITPLQDDIPFPVTKHQADFTVDPVMASPILSEESCFGYKYIIEVMRGCAHRCRFCLASYSTLPAQGPKLNQLLPVLEQGLKHTNKIGLLGALIADHPDFDSLCDFIQQQPDVEVSASSLRADTMTEHVAKTFVHAKQQSLTLAVESGSERVRLAINKHLKTDAILNAASMMSEAGLKQLKLYFMVGLPGEEQQDITESIALIREIKKQNKRLKLSVGCSTFVPKAQTPFQWQARLSTNELQKRQEQLRKGIYDVAQFRPSSAKWDTLQAWLSRGDRRLAPFIVDYAKLGGSVGSVNRAFKTYKKTMPDLDWYGLRERPENEIMPWEAVALAVPKEILYKEGQLSLSR